MYENYILVLPNFTERSDVPIANLLAMSNEEGLTEEVSKVISTGVHAHIITMMKTKNFGVGIDDYEIFTEYNLRDDLEDFDQFDLHELAFSLAVCDIPGSRGTRMVLIDVNNNKIFVGTAVVYNPRRATLGVVDDSVAELIIDF